MTAMRRYTASFYKTVTTDYGRDRTVCQQVVEVEAADEQGAAELAKQEFCRLRHLRDWRSHADSCDVVECG